jgi:hypothetical protein
MTCVAPIAHDVPLATTRSAAEYLLDGLEAA